MNVAASDVLKRVRFLSDLGLWAALPREADPKGWLANFEDPEDQRLAVVLLRSFIYASREIVDHLVLSAIQNVYTLLENPDPVKWEKFLDGVLLTYPTRDQLDVAASGHLFLRLARDEAGFREDQLVDPRDLVERVLSFDEPRTVLFIDDIAASGSQFIDTLLRRSSAESTSIADLVSAGRIARAYYAPAIATSYALRQIRELTPVWNVKAAHLLTGEYSASDPLTRLVRPEMRSSLDPFLRKYADRAGYSSEEPYGYHRLGLAIAFEHKIPDSTLPIFRSSHKDWNPLFR